MDCKDVMFLSSTTQTHWTEASPVYLTLLCGWTKRCDEQPERFMTVGEGLDYRLGRIPLQTFLPAFPPTGESKKQDHASPLSLHMFTEGQDVWTLPVQAVIRRSAPKNKHLTIQDKYQETTCKCKSTLK